MKNPAEIAVEKAVRLYTRHEDIADAVVHVLGIVFAIDASLWLLFHVTGLSVVVSVTVYCLGLLAMIGFSDHAAIFIMIAGTYTPFAMNRLGTYGTTILAIVWCAATFGVILKVLYPRRFEIASLVLYLGMGWLVVTVIAPLAHAMAAFDFWLLIAGGLVYSAGVAFYVIERIPYHKAIWHAAVLVAAVLQFSAIALEFVN
jgi:hemolysin III